jgi:NADH dehydrogenase
MEGNMNKILIVGGGYAGMYLGKLLNKKMKKMKNIEVTVVDRNPYHTLMTELHEVAGHRTEDDSVTIDLRKIFDGKNVKFEIEEITSIDFGKKVAKGKNKSYDFDYIVIGTGSEPNFFGIEGALENSLSLWSYKDALKIRTHIEEMFFKASKENNEKERRKLLSFSVAGGGFTGVEMIGELAEVKYEMSRKYNININEVSIHLIEGLSDILTMLIPKMRAKAVDKLIKMGIDLRLNSFITKVEKDQVTLKTGEIIETNTLIWAAGIQGGSFLKSLELSKDGRGRLSTNEYLQSIDNNYVFIAGDAASFSDDKGNMPQIVEAAMQSAHTVCENIINSIKGKELQKHKQNYHGFMVSIGSKYGVSDTMGLRLSGFFSLVIKHIINMEYIIKVSGINGVWNYLNHEFFRIKHDKSILRGHFSRSTPNFWLVPLRLFLGTMWLLEGLKKVSDGWLNPDNIYIIAVSGASESAESTPQIIPLLKEIPGIMQWFMDTVVASMPFVFQSVIVVSEILVGLALIGGAFTFLASIYSFMLTIGFILSGMADKSILWYTFASIATMGGAGRVLSIDYYLMPILKRIWKKFKFSRRNYLFFD